MKKSESRMLFFRNSTKSTSNTSRRLWIATSKKTRRSKSFRKKYANVENKSRKSSLNAKT